MFVKTLFSDKEIIPIFFLSLICVFVISVLSYHIERPGAYYDDNFMGVIAVKILNNFPASEYPSISVIDLFGHVFPYWGTYWGLVEAYLLLPFFYILNPNNISIKIYGIVIVVLTTIFIYLFSKQMFNKKVGLIAAFLFAISPSTIFLGKIPTASIFAMCLFEVSALYFLIKWKNTKKKSHMITAFVLLGLGIAIKMNFWWLILSLGISFFIFRPQLQINIKKIVLMTSSFLLGSAFFVIYLIKYNNSFLGFFTSRSTQTDQGASNVAIIPNILERLTNLNQLLSGSNFDWTGGLHSNYLLTYFFIISVVGIIILQIKKRNNFHRRAVFLIFILSVMLVSSIFTVSNRNFWQILIVLPITQIIIAIFIFEITDHLKKLNLHKSITPLFITSILSILFISNFIIINDYMLDLERTGGTDYFSPQIYDLMSYLNEINYNKIVFLDWGLQNQIFVQTNGKLKSESNLVYAGQNFDSFILNLETDFKDPNIIYLKYRTDSPVNGSSAHFFQTIKKTHKTAILLKTFKDWEGKDLYYVYRVE